MAALEQTHRQLLQQVQHERESLAEHQQRKESLTQENAQLRRQLTEATANATELTQRLAVKDSDTQASARPQRIGLCSMGFSSPNTQPIVNGTAELRPQLRPLHLCLPQWIEKAFSGRELHGSVAWEEPAGSVGIRGCLAAAMCVPCA